MLCIAVPFAWLLHLKFTLSHYLMVLLCFWERGTKRMLTVVAATVVAAVVLAAAVLVLAVVVVEVLWLMLVLGGCWWWRGCR